MAKNIEPKLKKICDYLKLDEDYIFSIPEYQRAYSWEVEHCEKLWQDIIDFVDCDRKDGHFFGTIIINCKDDEEMYELIDGQQRTTTFLLLLKALLIRINEAIVNIPGDEDSLNLLRGLQERRRKIIGILYKAETEAIADKPNAAQDAKLFENAIILKNTSINELYKTELATILQAVDYADAETNVTTIKYKQKDNRYTKFFRNFKFFYNKIDELHSDARLNRFAKAFTENCEVIEIKSWKMDQAINMFNCLNADGLPLYDSDILSAKLYAAASTNKEEATFKCQWEQLLDVLSGEELSGIVDLNAILMQYMYYVRTVNKETVTESGSINVTTPGLRRYFTDINRTPISNPVIMCNDMLKLAKIWSKLSSYAPLKLLLKFNENSKLFLASYFYRLDEENINEETVLPVLKCLLRLFALLELSDIGYSSKYFKTFLFKEEVQFVDSNRSNGDIKKDFDDHIHSNWTKDTVKDLLLNYDGNVLVHLNEYLFAEENAMTFVLGNKYDVEHIMPYSGHNLPVIRKDANIADEEEFYRIANKLGNKILLEEKINRSIGNEWFRTKISTTLKEKTGYLDSEYPLAQALVAHYKDELRPFWTKEDIAAATEKASNRILKFIFGE